MISFSYKNIRKKKTPYFLFVKSLNPNINVCILINNLIEVVLLIVCSRNQLIMLWFVWAKYNVISLINKYYCIINYALIQNFEI